MSPLYFIGGIALFCVFKNIKITKSFSISMIKFFAPVCFGVYLIHDNMIVDKYVLAKKFAFLANMDPISMIIGIILVGVGIFVACSLIDWIRELLFRKLKVKTRNWKCPKCGKILDRDITAAINILNRWFNGD